MGINVADENMIIDAYTIQKKTLKNISKDFNIKYKTVAEIIYKNGILPKTVHNPLLTDDVIIKEYVEHAKSIKQIKNEYHTSPEYIKKVLSSHGVKLHSLTSVSIGEKHNRLTVIERLKNNGRKAMFLCKCDCGNYRKVIGTELSNGNIKDCGCITNELRKKRIRAKRITHGQSNTKLYHCWIDMKSRCYRENDKEFKNYGKRGICVCDEWKNNFENFYKWALLNGYKEGLSIDRVDVNGIYEPTNCRWATATEQANNKRTSRKIYYKDIGKTASEWSKILPFSKYAIYEYAQCHNWQIETYLKYKKINVEDYLCLK